MGRLQSIPLSNIITSPRLQNRNAAAPCLREKLPHSQATIEHLDTLKLAIKRGEHLPPVSVIRAEPERGERFYLVDGFHRYWAHDQLKRETIEANILEGCGLVDALIASGKANQNHGLRLTKDERVENAWRCLNLAETDYYRSMNKTEAEAALGVDRETIKKMRQKVRQRGIAASSIDPALSGKAAEAALLEYWNENPAQETWRLARRDGTNERKDSRWQEKKAAREIAQLLANIAGAYGPEVAKKAMFDVGYHLHNLKATEGIDKLQRTFSVSPQPLPSDDEATLSAAELEDFLAWQKTQDFDYQPPSLFNEADHLSTSSDF
jgi:uncharacterized ParB-like nuclease family protein/transposase